MEDGKTLMDIVEERLETAPETVRVRLPRDRESVTHHFQVGSMDGYVTVGLYPSRRPGELFITMAKEGSTVGGLLDVIGVLTSLALQHGVPLDHLVGKLKGVSFEPSGFTGNPDIPIAHSPVDYIFRWLERKFLAANEDKVEEK